MNRRDFVATLAATALVPEAFASAESTPVMGSQVFDWDAIPAKPNASGSVRSFCSSPTATLQNLELHATTLNPGMSPHPPHRHPNEEIIVVREGTLEVLQNGEWKRIGAGSVVFNASNQFHGLRNAGKEPANYQVINVKTAATPAA